MPTAPSGATGRRAAFTLLELLAVITLIALLAGIVFGLGRRAATAGKVARAQAELAALAVALEGYRQTYGDYPRTDDAGRLLQSLLGRRSPANAVIHGRALIELARFSPSGSGDGAADAGTTLLDPWDRAYVYAYKVPAGGWTNSSYVLYSPGPDGKDEPVLLPGGFVDSTPRENADNIHAYR